MNLRILIVSDHYPPFIGGAHIQTQLLSHELKKRGHQVSVATVWQPGLPAVQEEDGIQVHRLKQVRTLLPASRRDRRQRHQPPYPDPVTIAGLRRLITRFQPDVVHSYGWISYSAAAALLGKDIPLLISARDYGYFCATRSLLYHDRTCSGPAPVKCAGCAAEFYGAPKGLTAVASVFLGRPLLIRKVRGIHSVSQYVLDVMERDLYGDDRRLLQRHGGPVLERVIPSFLIPQEQRQAGDEDFARCLPEQPFMLYVGGLQHRKGVGSLLAAYQKLSSPPPLVLIGYQAPDMPKEFPPGVTVLHDVSHPNVMQAWDRCLFGVTPSLWPDPSPGVVREAMSRGKAVIVTEVGGSTEMIDENVNGILVPPGDDQALANAMQRLADNRELSQTFGQAGRERSRQYMAEAVIPQFEQLYRQLLNASSKPASGERVHVEAKRYL